MRYWVNYFNSLAGGREVVLMQGRSKAEVSDTLKSQGKQVLTIKKTYRLPTPANITPRPVNPDNGSHLWHLHD